MAKQLFILCDGFGTRSLTPASIDAATQLYFDQKQYFWKELKDLLAHRMDPANNISQYRNPETMIKAMVELLEQPVGTKSRSLCFLMHGNKSKGLSYDQDDRPPVFVQENWKQEMATWILPFVFERHRSMNDWENVVHNAILSRNAHPEEELSFLQKFRQKADPDSKGILWTNPDNFDMAEEAKVIEKKQWKPEAKTERVVQRILDFVNQFTHRDVKYECIEVEIENQTPELQVA